MIIRYDGLAFKFFVRFQSNELLVKEKHFNVLMQNERNFDTLLNPYKAKKSNDILPFMQISKSRYCITKETLNHIKPNTKIQLQEEKHGSLLFVI